MDGRKIPNTMENPIDNILINISNYLNPYLKKLNFTPNIITTISLVVTLIGIYYIYKGKYKIGSILYFIGYFFDCMDGNYARMYNMVTSFGDLYDHISDTIKYVILLIVIFNLKNIKKKTKLISLSIIIISIFISFVHFGCQQDNYKDNSILDRLKVLCPNRRAIHYTRYLGCGTSVLITTLIIYNLRYLNKVLK